jgi:phospholipase C
MKCFNPDKLPVLTGLAQEFAVCDHWFSSVPGPTLPNRAFAHTATSHGHVDMNPVAYWNVRTLYEHLATVNVTSRVYSFDGNTLAFTFRRLFEGGTKYLGSYSDFLDDLDGKLPGYCFLEPRFNDWYDSANHKYYLATDQHPDNNVVEGERFIGEVYKAIRASKYWKKTLFVIVYDEHGGFYDHVPPPSNVVHPEPNLPIGEFDFTRLGVRVPAILVSPYIKPGTIVHKQLEHSSLSASARKLLAPTLPHLTERDRFAGTFNTVFNLNQPRDTPPHFRMKRASDVDPNTHGTGPLSEQQRSQVMAAYYVDLSRAAGKRILGSSGKPKTLDEINTEQKAADYIRDVNASLVNP